jgi:Cft2 family RNA processing exonuclease
VERIEARPCELLVLPCHFGQRRFVFPPFEEVAAELLRFVRDGLDRGEAPVLFCSPLGEAQEVAHLLLEAGVRCRVHRQIFAACRVYQQAGAPLGNIRSYNGRVDEDEALLWPVGLRDSASLKKLAAKRTALVSGMALDEACRKQAGCDAAFVLSSHADYAGLLEYVRACEPKHVVLTQGATKELEEDLGALGMSVTSIGAPEQMDLF